MFMEPDRLDARERKGMQCDVLAAVMPREVEEDLWTFVFSLLFGSYLLVPSGHPLTLEEPKGVMLKDKVNLSSAEETILVCPTEIIP